MKSQHVDNRKLYEVVREKTVLNDTELEHLGSCEECLQFIRILVAQLIRPAAS